MTGREPMGRGQWNAYVAAGASREERRARMDACPKNFRADVMRHVETVFALRQRGKTPGGGVSSTTGRLSTTDRGSISR